MKRLRIPLAVAAAASALPAIALGIPNQTDYRGDFEGGGQIGFDIKKTDSGKKRVKNVVATITFTCEGGDPGTVTLFLDGSFPIARDRTFGGKTSAQIPPAIDPPAKITGKLRRHHKVRGTFRSHGQLDPVDQPDAKCDTGTQDWKAAKVQPF